MMARTAALPAFVAALGGAAFAQDITATVRGTVQFDAVALADGVLPPGETMASGGNFRRIRIGVAGRIGQDWSYEFTPRLEASSIHFLSIGNAFVQYDGLGPLHLKLGAFAPASNFEDATASGETLFLERAQPADLARTIGGSPGRTTASVFAYDEDYFASVSYTAGLINDAIDRQQAIVSRFAWRPWFTEGGSFAIGADMTHLLAPPRTGAAREVRLRVRPELNTKVVDLRLLDTGALTSDGLTEFGIEAGGNFDNLYAQAGLFHFAVDRAQPALADPLFGGWYLQGSWIVTGERRAWRINRGGHGAPAPATPLGDGGFGAVELSARYSEMDLDDAAVRGGRQTIATLGLNWYPTQSVRLMLNYQSVTVDRMNGAGGDLGADMDLLSLRTQFQF